MPTYRHPARAATVAIGQVAEGSRRSRETAKHGAQAVREAAGAGEHGRGFAVVADEVRKLAERSQQRGGGAELGGQRRDGGPRCWRGPR